MKDLEELFEEEKTWLREAGAEFAAANPRLATFLGGVTAEAADPHVDRILEAVAFFSARLERRFDQSLMRLAQEILGICYPALLAPQPALCLVRYEPGPAMGPQRFVPVGVRMVNAPMGSSSATVQVVTTEPCVVSWLVPTALALEEAELGVATRLKISVGRADGAPIAKDGWPSIYTLTPFWNNLSHGCVFFAAMRCVSRPPEVRVLRGVGDVQPLRPAPVVKLRAPEDFSAVLESEPEQFPGLRMLKEFFALPQRFMQLEIAGLDSCPALDGARGLEIEFLLPVQPSELRPFLEKANFVPNVVAVANRWLGEARAVNYDGTLTQYDLVPDRRSGGEILRVNEVRAIRPGQRNAQVVPRFDYFDRSRLAYAARSDVGSASDGSASDSTRWLIEVHEGDGEPGPPFRLVTEIVGCDREGHRVLENARLTNHDGLPQDVRCATLGTPSRFVPALASEAEYWALIAVLSAGIQQLGEVRSLRRLLSRLNRTEDRLAVEAIASIQQVDVEQQFTTVRQEPRKIYRVRIKVAAGRGVASYWAPLFDVLHDFLRLRLPLNTELELHVVGASGEEIVPPRSTWAGRMEA